MIPLIPLHTGTKFHERLSEAALLIDEAAQNNNKIKAIDRELNLFLQKINKINKLDTDLAETMMYQSTTPDDTIPIEEFPAKLPNIDQDSLIIFIENAQLYRVYKSDDMQKFIDHYGTIFKRAKDQGYGSIHEVVRDDCPQKLIICVREEDNSKVTEISRNIIEFLNMNPKFTNVTDKDLVIYRNGGLIEFIVQNVQMENDLERRNYIDNFCIHVQEKGNQALYDQVEPGPKTANVRGTHHYKLPSDKVRLSKQNINETDSLLTVKPESTHINVNISNYVMNTVNGNNIVNNGNNNTNNVETITKTTTVVTKSIKSYLKYLYDTKPDWYVEGKMVDIKTIKDSYDSYFGGETNANIISKKLNGLLFDKGSRSSNKTSKKLVTFNSLKKTF